MLLLLSEDTIYKMPLLLLSKDTLYKMLFLLLTDDTLYAIMLLLLSDDTLYWIDEMLHRIERCDFNGGSRVMVLQVSDTRPLDIVINGDFLYFNSWNNT